MSYEKKTWQCGDTISAEELNRMENGIEEAQGGGGSTPLTVNVSLSEESEEFGTDILVLDKTWQEIANAYPNTRFVTTYDDAVVYFNAYAVQDAGGDALDRYEVIIYADGSMNATNFVADTPNDYPKTKREE